MIDSHIQFGSELNRKQLIEVDSCFGGMALYPVKPICQRKCRYSSSSGCEHLDFHKCLKSEHDSRLCVSASLLLYYGMRH